MSKEGRLHWIAVGFVFCGFTVGCLAQRPEPNAFLNKPAHSTAQLVAQAKNDPEVMARFMKHFQMNRAEVISYLSSLKLVKLTEDGNHTVYHSDEDDGDIGYRLLQLKKGSLLWADADGTLVLKKACGNPLSNGPRQIAYNPRGKFEAALIPKSILRDLPKKGDTEPLALIPTTEVLEPTFVPTKEDTIRITDALPPLSEPLPPPPVIGPGGPGLPWPIFGLPLLLIGGGGGGGSTGGLPCQGPDCGGGGEVPGPAAAIVFLTIPAMVRAYAKKRRK